MTIEFQRVRVSVMSQGPLDQYGSIVLLQCPHCLALLLSSTAKDHNNWHRAMAAQFKTLETKVAAQGAPGAKKNPLDDLFGGFGGR